MKSKQTVVGGAVARRVVRQSLQMALAVGLLGVSALACRSGNGGQENGTPADPGPALGQGSDVVRYSGMEVNDSGQAGIRQAVQARRAADWSSTTVATLYPGTVVNRIARYGNYNLVSWTGSAGAQQGWVDTNVAFSSHRIIDAGTGIQPPTVFGATPINQPPVVTAPPPPVVTAPPPVVTAPPPVVTAPPKPTSTVAPPKPTSTVRTGFKPPKLN